MKAGRELDLLIAEKVMDYKPCKGNHSYACQLPIGPCWIREEGPIGNTHGHMWEINCPPYSTDIAAAWEVVEKMRENYWCFLLTDEVTFWKVEFENETHKPYASSPNVPHAICLAALKAKGMEK